MVTLIGCARSYVLASASPSAGVLPLTRDDASPFAAPSAFGPFRVMHQIGVGVLGPVFRTYEPSQDRLVAVKAFHLDVTPEQARTLIEVLEGLITTELAHPGIVAPLAVGLEDDVPYLAQEYVAAESLDVAIRHYVPASIKTAMPLIRQMSAAVDAAHAVGVVHGALHLRDVFVTPDEARATGFGIFTALEEIGLAGPIRRPYTAPEVIAGREWGAGADRFTLAAIAYELLTGRRAAGTGDQVTERIRSIDGVSDPENLEEVFGTALADDPEDRYSSGNRFVSALEFCFGEETGHEVGVEREEESHRDTRPPDLLAGLELHQQDLIGDQILNSVERLEATAPDDDDIANGESTDDDTTLSADLVVEPQVSTLDFGEIEPSGQADNQKVLSVEQPAESSVDTAPTEDEEDDVKELEFQSDGFADESDDDPAEGYGDNADGEHADLKVMDHLTESDERSVADDQGDDDSNYDHSDAIQVPPHQIDKVHSGHSVRGRGVVAVLAIALAVGSAAYFLGVALAPNSGPIDQLSKTPSTSSNTVGTGGQEGQASFVNRELNDELVPTGTPTRPSNSAAEAPPGASKTIESDSDTVSIRRSAPEAQPISSLSAGTQEREESRTQAVRVSPSGAMASFSSPEVSPQTGWLLVRTDPPGATVTLDGVGRGQTPLSLADVSFGTHRLEMSHAEFGTVQREVTVSEQDTIVPVGVRLTPVGLASVAEDDALQTGSLAVQSRPAGAEVTIDGTSAGVTPFVVTLPVGRHQILIQGDGYQAWVTSAEVTMSERAQVNASLERLTP